MYLQESNWGGKVEWKKKEARCNANQIYSVSGMYLSELYSCRDIWECEKGRQTELDYLQKSLNFGSWEWLDGHLWIGDWVQSEQGLKTRAHQGSVAQGWDMTLQSERKTGSDHTRRNSWRIWAEQAAVWLSSQSWCQVCWERELGVSIWDCSRDSDHVSLSSSDLRWLSVEEKEMATHSSILAWRILWTKEPGGLLSIGSAQGQTRLKQLSSSSSSVEGSLV